MDNCTALMTKIAKINQGIINIPADDFTILTAENNGSITISIRGTAAAKKITEKTTARLSLLYCIPAKTNNNMTESLTVFTLS